MPALPPGLYSLCGGGLLEQARVSREAWAPGAPHLPANICQALCFGKDGRFPSTGPGVLDGQAASGAALGAVGPTPTLPQHAGDAFRGLGHTDNQEGCGFSTLDRDHDRCSPCVDGAQTFASCSHDRSGAGWWYSNCGRADLNGLWPEQAGAASGMRWAAGDHQPALRASLLRVHTTASGKA